MFGFGGSGSSKDNNTTSPASASPSDATQSSTFSVPATTSSSLSPSSDTLTRLQTAISQQTAVANARLLIAKVNEHCFDHCITAPGTSLSSGEQKCLSACMEKYLDAWNVTNRTYLSRISKDLPGVVGQSGGPAAGKELF